MLAIDGWLLHVAKQADGSLLLNFQHESCGAAAASSSRDRPNEVLLRCSGVSRRCGRYPDEAHEITAEDGAASETQCAPPTTISLENVEAADVAQSVVSTLLTSLTNDTSKTSKTKRYSSTTTAFELEPFAANNDEAELRRGRKRGADDDDSIEMMIEEAAEEESSESTESDNDEQEEEEEEDEDCTRCYQNALKRRRRWRADDVKSALGSPCSPSPIDPTFSGMPAEIQLHILQLVPMLDLLRTVPLVSRQWNDLVRDDGLWRLLKTQYFGSATRPSCPRGFLSQTLHDKMNAASSASSLSLLPSFRDQCISFLRELKVLQQKHHRRLYEEERSYRQHQLIWGCSGGHASFVHDLFRYHDSLIDVDMLSASGNHAERTPLMVAVAAGNDGVASFLLLEKNADVNRATSDGSTPLMIAASKGHKNAVQFLLDQRAEVNRITKNGCSALMLAALAGHEEIAALLLERGADPCGKTVDGSTALMIAVSKGNKQIVYSLLQHTPANQRSHVVNETRKDGWTALMIASTKGEEELVRVLVKHGAEVNKRKTGDGCTALMFAAAKGHDEIVRFLLSHHADVNTRNRDGWSALMIAADWGHKGCVEVFIENKDLFTANGHPFGRVNLRMALIVAFMKKYYDIFSLLLQVGPP